MEKVKQKYNGDIMRELQTGTIQSDARSGNQKSDKERESERERQREGQKSKDMVETEIEKESYIDRERQIEM